MNAATGCVEDYSLYKLSFVFVLFAMEPNKNPVKMEQ